MKHDGVLEIEFKHLQVKGGVSHSHSLHSKETRTILVTRLLFLDKSVRGKRGGVSHGSQYLGRSLGAPCQLFFSPSPPLTLRVRKFWAWSGRFGFCRESLIDAKRAAYAKVLKMQTWCTLERIVEHDLHMFVSGCPRSCFPCGMSSPGTQWFEYWGRDHSGALSSRAVITRKCCCVRVCLRHSYIGILLSCWTTSQCCHVVL